MTTDLTEAEAAAILLEEHLSNAGRILATGRNGNLVSFATSGAGHHLGNVHEDYDADVHLVCEPGEVKRGSLSDRMPESATVYVNIVVNGLKPGWEGGAVPTHHPVSGGRPPGVRDRGECPGDVWEAAAALGIYNRPTE